MNPVYDSGSQLDTPIQHWDKEWWNNSCDCHHNWLYYNATANIIYVCNRRLSSQLLQYVTPLIFSYLHRELYLFKEASVPLLIHYSLLSSCRSAPLIWYTATRLIYNDTIISMSIQGPNSGRQAATIASGCFHFFPVEVEQTCLESHVVSHLKEKNIEQMTAREDGSIQIVFL